MENKFKFVFENSQNWYFDTDIKVMPRRWMKTWSHGLKREFAATHYPELPLRIPPVAWKSLSYECCLLWVTRGLCDGPIPRPEESYRVCARTRCTSTLRQPRPELCCSAIKDELIFLDVSENTAFYMFTNVNYHTQFTAMYVWVCVCVGLVRYGCFDNCVGVLVVCVLVFTVFFIVCTVFFCFVYVYLFLFVLSELV
jgi:hypothetical protein